MRWGSTKAMWGGVAVAVGLAAATAGCGDGGDDSATGGSSGAGCTEVDAAPVGEGAASPFLVDAVPERFHLATAGQGTQQQDWGSDSFGTHEPLTVLAPEGWSGAEEAMVIVSVTGFEGYQGGLAQASAGYLDDPEQLDLDGRDAIYTPADEDRWADLVVDCGDDVAVRVTAADAGRDDLAAIAARVQPAADHRHAPGVPEPPDDMSVVGSVDAGVVVSLVSSVDTAAGVPGTEDAFGAGWVSGASAPSDPGQPPPVSSDLTVVSYPGQTADQDALRGLAPLLAPRDASVTSLTVDGRPAVLFEQTTPSAYENESPWAVRTVFTHAPWGDLLMAGTSGDLAAIPTVDELVAALASTREATPEEWDAFVATASSAGG